MMVAAVALSLSAQVVEAERSVIEWIVAAIPALGFLVMVKIALAQAGSSSRSEAATVAVAGLSGCVEVPLPVAEEVADAMVIALIPVARAVADALERERRRHSRQALAAGLRQRGIRCSIPGSVRCRRSCDLSVWLCRIRVNRWALRRRLRVGRPVR